MSFNYEFPEWKNEGTPPPEELQTNGFEGGDKPPAGWLNWLCSLVSKCITEIQNKFKSHTEDKNNPHSVTAAQVGLGNVNNTSDAEKNVAFAREAATSRKVVNALVMRFKGGSTEGTDLFTYDGSGVKSVNITADKIGGAKADLSNVDNTVFKKKVEDNVMTGTPIVEAISTDGELYTATVNGITELYNGLEITIIPNMTSTKAAVQFNLNGFGDKNVRAKINGYNNGNSGTMAALAGWIGENVPLTIRYIAKFDNWQTVDFSRPSASGLYGTVKIEQGGTGADTAEEARENLSVYSKDEIDANNGWKTLATYEPADMTTANNVTLNLNANLTNYKEALFIFEPFGETVTGKIEYRANSSSGVILDERTTENPYVGVSHLLIANGVGAYETVIASDGALHEAKKNVGAINSISCYMYDHQQDGNFPIHARITILAR